MPNANNDEVDDVDDSWIFEDGEEVPKSLVQNVYDPKTQDVVGADEDGWEEEETVNPNSDSYLATCYKELLQNMYLTGVLEPDMDPKLKQQILLDLLNG